MERAEANNHLLQNGDNGTFLLRPGSGTAHLTKTSSFSKIMSLGFQRS